MRIASLVLADFPPGMFASQEGRFRLRIEVAGANASSNGAKYFFGLDCVTVTEPCREERSESLHGERHSVLRSASS